MPFLSWISDANLVQHTATLMTVIHQARDRKQREFHKNVIDPFLAIFEMSGYPMNADDWKGAELTRQVGKSVQNQIGVFHQNVLGSAAGWENLGTGQIVDLCSRSSKVIAEVKNKHNTVKGSNKVDVYDQLHSLVMPKASNYNGYQAYFVTIIPEKPVRFDRPFTPSDNTNQTNRPKNVLIREIDGASFYHLVTGDETALSDLYQVLPKVIEQVLGKAQLSKKDCNELHRYFNLAFG